jgi:ubiquinone biosynthesis protein
MVGHLPALASRAEALAEQLAYAADKGFPLDARSIAEIGRAEARRNRWGNLALWIIAGVLLAVAMRVL